MPNRGRREEYSKTMKREEDPGVFYNTGGFGEKMQLKGLGRKNPSTQANVTWDGHIWTSTAKVAGATKFEGGKRKPAKVVRVGRQSCPDQTWAGNGK